MCSHSEADLADGEVYDCKVECPLHGAEFDLKTGEALTLPATKPVTVFTTEVDGDSLVVKENLYHYVMSRGIDKTAAEKLLIKGFFNEVISEDGWGSISDKVSEEIMQKYLNVLERSK